MKMSMIMTAALLAASAAQAGPNVSVPLTGIGAPIAPVSGVGAVRTPGMSVVLPNLPAVSIPRLPTAGVPLAVPGAQSPTETLRLIEAALPQQQAIGNLPAGAAHGAGARMSDAVTGESTINGGGDGFSPPASPEVDALEIRVANAKRVTDKVIAEVSKLIVGQEEMKRGILMGIIMNEHVLLEGFPGVAKTVTAKAFAAAIDGKYERVQGTPDLEPSDITGSSILQENAEGRKEFVLRKGPAFSNILLLDEINRMVPKTQSGVLEAMGEGQITIDGVKYPLPHFTVIATQNPLEQQGTYPLPEAQQDRFGLKILVPQPEEDDVNLIADRVESKERIPTIEKVADLAQLDVVRRVAEDLHMEDAVKKYATKLVMAPSKHPDIKDNVDYSSYVRAAIKLRRMARIRAVMEGRSYVTPEDVQAMYPSVMRQRIAKNFSAEADVESIIQKVLDTIEVPKGQDQSTKGQDESK